MKKIKFSIFAFFVVLLSCKPDKSPEPLQSVSIPILKISLQDNVYELEEKFLPKTVLVSGKDTIPNTDPVIWTILEKDIASVESDGFIKTKKIGGFSLIAQSKAMLDTVLVNVVSKKNLARSIILSATEMEFFLNSTQQLELNVLDKSNQNISIENTTWTSSNINVGKVDEAGIFTATGFGETEISVQSNGLQSNKIVLTVFRNGIFVGKQGYTSSGNVRLVSCNSQLFIETQSDFKVQSGPDLRLYLSNSEFGSVVSSKGLELALLKSNSGINTYSVPISVKINEYKFIVVQCKQFSVTFGSATLN